jgi:hypothetical protein
MNTYKIIFAKNTVMTCEIVNKVVLANDHYEQQKGHLIYAIIKAESEADAVNKANEMIKVVTENNFG